MKTLIFTVVLMASGFANAANLGEVDMKDCECKTCLIERGVCVRTHTNSERNIYDKSTSSPKKNKKGPAGAVKT